MPVEREKYPKLNSALDIQAEWTQAVNKYSFICSWERGNRVYRQQCYVEYFAIVALNAAKHKSAWNMEFVSPRIQCVGPLPARLNAPSLSYVAWVHTVLSLWPLELPRPTERRVCSRTPGTLSAQGHKALVAAQQRLSLTFALILICGN